jgi:hypothetical protein
MKKEKGAKNAAQLQLEKGLFTMSNLLYSLYLLSNSRLLLCCCLIQSFFLPCSFIPLPHFSLPTPPFSGVKTHTKKKFNDVNKSLSTLHQERQKGERKVRKKRPPYIKHSSSRAKSHDSKASGPIGC